MTTPSKRLILSSWQRINRCLSHHIPSENSARLVTRLCSSTPALLQTIKKKINPFGKLIINLPYHVEIKPTDPHEYPDMDTLLIKTFCKDNPQNASELVSVDVSGTCEIRAVKNENISDVTCTIEAPVRYDVDLRTAGEGNVTISDMVSDSISVQTEFGNIVANKLQGQKISLSSSEGGSVVLQKSIQGNIEINTAKDGVVNAEKCLGTRLDVSTENGNVVIGSNYCEKATFSTLNGNLVLNNLHMDSKIDICGNGSLDITCLDGSLEANVQTGLTIIKIVRVTGDSKVKSSGEIILTLSDSDVKLLLEAGELDIDPNIAGTYTKDSRKFISHGIGPKFEVQTDKIVQVTRSSWMESLKLGKRSK